MIKFKIHPKIWEGERCKFGKVLEKCQNYKLNKMKDNLGQECVKGGFYPSTSKLEQLSLISLAK